MQKFRISTDENISVWQRVGLIIEADNEAAAQALLNDPAAFNAAMSAGRVQYSGLIVDPYWETESNLGWDHATASLDLIPEATI